jgi:glycosyltransferase involved in cell wall biosynthesis
VINDNMAMIPALYYSSESYSVKGQKLMGRQAAGEAFLRAFIDAYPDTPVNALLHSPLDSKVIDGELKELGSVLPSRKHTLNALDQADFNLLYLPSPGIADLARNRLRVGERQFSLCGVTHTTATHRVMESIAELMVEPVRPWDAVICTSTSVKRSVELILAEQAEYLKWKLGATRFELPQLPVIPLGVHCADYQFTQEVKQQSRKTLNIQADDVVVLFVGRLSFHAKAHPHPMLAACQYCAEKLPKGKKLHLIQCGWFANDNIADAFDELQQYLAPNVVHHYLDGRDKTLRTQAWSSADIFASFSDNIQETFGLTPIEAMAAGMPVLVSDWDGYKDTITHGEVGFRVKTLMPPAGNARDLAARYDLGDDTYDMYCGQLCEMIGVDIPEACDYLWQLVSQPALRQSMGNAGKARAEKIYSWQQVMRRYIELWEELHVIRTTSIDHFGGQPWLESPTRMDPFKMFEDYPSKHVVQGTHCRNVRRLTQDEHRQLVELKTHRFAKRVLPSFTLVDRIQQTLANTHDLGDVVLSCAKHAPQRDVERAIAWLHKVGAIALQ